MKYRTLIVVSLMVLGSSLESAWAGPISGYCDKLRAQLINVLNTEPVVEDKQGINFEVDKDGRIYKVQSDRNGSEKVKEAAEKKIELLGKVAAPPKAPLRLWAFIGKKPEEVKVTWRDIDFAPYIANMQQKIRGEWRPPRTRAPWKMAAVFSVGRNGEIGDVRVYSSSGMKDADAAGLKAVHDASPLPELPDGSPLSVDMQMVFDYKPPTDAATSGAVAEGEE